MPITKGKPLRLNVLSLPGDRTAFGYVKPHSLSTSQKARNLRKKPRKGRGFKFLPGQPFETQLCQRQDKLQSTRGTISQMQMDFEFQPWCHAELSLPYIWLVQLRDWVSGMECPAVCCTVCDVIPLSIGPSRVPIHNRLVKEIHTHRQNSELMLMPGFLVPRPILSVLHMLIHLITHIPRK